ncbi:MAG TPA: guanylate kinase [Gemmatimonadaceae bacterium]
MRAFPLILSAPSGGGKTTIARELLRRRPDLGYSVSCTTRAPREGERNGADYTFISRDEFVSRRSNGEFAESAEVHGELYGTLRNEVDRILKSGRHVVMDIDVQGTRQFAAAYPDAVLVFLLPPNPEVLVERLRARGTETTAELARRLRNAIGEVQSVGLYHYVVVNDDLERAVKAVSGIVDAETARTGRSAGLSDHVGRLVAGLEREIEAIEGRS